MAPAYNLSASKHWETSEGPHPSSYKLQASSSKPQATSSETSRSKPQATSNKRQASSRKRQAARYLSLHKVLSLEARRERLG